MEFEYIYYPRKREFIKMWKDGERYRIEIPCFERDHHTFPCRIFDKCNRSTFKAVKCNICYLGFVIEGGIISDG